MMYRTQPQQQIKRTNSKSNYIMNTTTIFEIRRTPPSLQTLAVPTSMSSGVGNGNKHHGASPHLRSPASGSPSGTFTQTPPSSLGGGGTKQYTKAKPRRDIADLQACISFDAKGAVLYKSLDGSTASLSSISTSLTRGEWFMVLEIINR